MKKMYVLQNHNDREIAEKATAMVKSMFPDETIYQAQAILVADIIICSYKHSFNHLGSYFPEKLVFMVYIDNDHQMKFKQYKPSASPVS